MLANTPVTGTNPGGFAEGIIRQFLPSAGYPSPGVPSPGGVASRVAQFAEEQLERLRSTIRTRAQGFVQAVQKGLELVQRTVEQIGTLAEQARANIQQRAARLAPLARWATFYVERRAARLVIRAGVLVARARIASRRIMKRSRALLRLARAVSSAGSQYAGYAAIAKAHATSMMVHASLLITEALARLQIARDYFMHTLMEAFASRMRVAQFAAQMVGMAGAWVRQLRAMAQMAVRFTRSQAQEFGRWIADRVSQALRIRNPLDIVGFVRDSISLGIKKVGEIVQNFQLTGGALWNLLQIQMLQPLLWVRMVQQEAQSIALWQRLREAVLKAHELMDRADLMRHRVHRKLAALDLQAGLAATAQGILAIQQDRLDAQTQGAAPASLAGHQEAERIHREEQVAERPQEQPEEEPESEVAAEGRQQVEPQHRQEEDEQQAEGPLDPERAQASVEGERDLPPGAESLERPERQAPFEREERERGRRPPAEPQPQEQERNQRSRVGPSDAELRSHPESANPPEPAPTSVPVPPEPSYRDGQLTGPFYPMGWTGPIVRGPRQALAQGAQVYVNGVLTDSATHARAARELANQTGRPVVGVYNASSGATDFVQCLRDKIGLGGLGRMNPATNTLREVILAFGNPRSEGGGLDIYAHSQGSIILSEALRQARGEGGDISGVGVTTFGNAAWTMPEGLREQHHYVFDADVVSTSVGSTGPIAWLMRNTPIGAITRALGFRSTAEDTTTLHHSGSGIRPHGVVPDPVLGPDGQPLRDAQGNIVYDTEASYIGSLHRFRAAEARRRSLTSQGPAGRLAEELGRFTMPNRSVPATAFAFARAAASGVAEAVEGGYNRLAPAVPAALAAVGAGPAARGAWSLADRALRRTGNFLLDVGSGIASSWDRGMAALQRQGTGPNGLAEKADPVRTRAELLAAEGMGSPLPSDLRMELGPYVGFDPARARVHVGPAAARAARELQASAFTIGEDIFFGAGQYDPTSPKGRSLIAHELTHVLQQTGGGVAKPRSFTQAGGDDMEQEAQQVAERVLSHAQGQAGGLRVDDYVRRYESVDQRGLTVTLQNRLDALSLVALNEAERKLRGLGLEDTYNPAVVEVAIDVDLSAMSDAQVADVWSDAIVAQLVSLYGRPGTQLPTTLLDAQPALSLQRVFYWGMSNRQKIDYAIQNRDVGAAKAITSFGEASDSERISIIRLLLDQWWVGPSDESAIERIWEQWEREGKLASIAAASDANWQLFQSCLDRGAELDDLRTVTNLKSYFRWDVREKAKEYMRANRRFVNQELESLGVYENMCPANPPTEQQQRDRLREIQVVAEVAKRGQEAMQRMTELHVGYVQEAFQVGDPGFGPSMHQYHDVPKRFDPLRPPQSGPTGREDPPWPTWQQVKQRYDEVQGVVMTLANRYPSIYAAVREDRLGDIAQRSPQQARQAIVNSLLSVRSKIDETLPKIDSGDLDDRDLKPIHDQLFAKQTMGPNQIDWSGRFNQWAAKDLLSDHESRQFWLTLGLATLAAAAFVVATLATGGVAAVALGVGLGIGAGQAISSWEQYEDLRTASRTNVTDDTALVTQSQVDAALLAAVLDTAFFFLDAFSAPAQMGKIAARTATREAIQAGLRVATLEGLETLGRRLPTSETRTLVERAIAELGVEGTMRRTGMSADQLLLHLGPDSPQARRVLAFKDMVEVGIRSTAEVMEKLPRLADEIASGALTLAQADRLVVQAIEQLGPKAVLQRVGGWKQLASIFKGRQGFVAGEILENWRVGIKDQLDNFLRQATNAPPNEQLLQRTGTPGWASDMDISLLGANASSNRTRAWEFLQGRLGIGPEDAHNLLYMDLFTDPRRMHLYDQLAEPIRAAVATRRAAFEQELIWNRRLYDAVQSGDQALARDIRRQMSEMGVREVPYQPLSQADIGRLSSEIDSLHGQLEAAVRSGDQAAQQRLASQIAEKQALINATEGGGYFSGGGVRRFVSERDRFPGFGADMQTRMLPSQQFTAVLDQLPKLQEQASALIRATDPTKVRAALKSFTKYRGRIREVLGEAIGGNFPPGQRFDELAEAFQELLRTEQRDPAVMARLVSEGQALRSQLETASSEVLRGLRERAAMEGVQGGFEGVQAMTRAHLDSLAKMDAIIERLLWTQQNLNTFRPARALLDAPDEGEEGGARGQTAQGSSAPQSQQQGTQPSASQPQPAGSSSRPQGASSSRR